MQTPAIKRRILVVDDNLDAAVSLCRFLETLGHDAYVARTGYEAVDLARRLRPEFVMLDIGLPGFDGFQVAETLRRDPALASARIIAVTGHGREEDRERSRAAGIDYHLLKPIDLQFLESLVGNAAGKPATP